MRCAVVKILTSIQACCQWCCVTEHLINDEVVLIIDDVSVDLCSVLQLQSRLDRVEGQVEAAARRRPRPVGPRTRRRSVLRLRRHRTQVH